MPYFREDGVSGGKEVCFIKLLQCKIFGMLTCHMLGQCVLNPAAFKAKLRSLYRAML